MYLLDSSAWLAHLFGEPGVESINQLFDENQSGISISVLSIPEIFTRLKAMGQETQWQNVWTTYEPLFDNVIPVDVTIAQKAIDLRSTTPTRLPTIDALIVSTALVNKSILVHRDKHMAALPESVIQQIQLPDK